jgi:hypothetical protein
MRAEQRTNLLTRHRVNIGSRRLFFVLLAVTTSFAAGIHYGQRLPATFYTRPVATLQLMSEFPVGSKVLPLYTWEAQEHFARLGWSSEPAVIVGYEAVTIRDREELLCQVRIFSGAGPTILVNPRRIAPLRDRAKDY